MRNRGQILIVVAILIGVALMLLAVAVDGGRLYIQRTRMQRAAQAAANAGVAVAGEQMATLAVPHMTQAAAQPPCTPDAGFGTPFAACTATPPPPQIVSWLTDEDRASLAAPLMQTQVAAEALEYLSRNGMDEALPEVEYPFAYSPTDAVLRLMIRLRQQVTVLLAGLLQRDLVDLSAEGLSQIPQR